MSGPDRTAQAREAAAWFDAAQEDLRLVRAALDLEPSSYAGATFHCQQAAEKTVKGLLVAAARRVPRTHDLERLSDLCVRDWPDLRSALEPCRPLTQWSTEFRYPRPDAVAEQVPSVAEIERIRVGLQDLLSIARSAVGRARR